MAELKTKISILRGFMAAEDWKSALRLAAGFSRLGSQKEAITRGWNAIQYPGFYLSIGRNPDSLIAEAIRALHERFDE